jgi:hypothetical protein
VGDSPEIKQFDGSAERLRDAFAWQGVHHQIPQWALFAGLIRTEFPLFEKKVS